jgi:hypothetical protein
MKARPFVIGMVTILIAVPLISLIAFASPIVPGVVVPVAAGAWGILLIMRLVTRTPARAVMQAHNALSVALVITYASFFLFGWYCFLLAHLHVGIPNLRFPYTTPHISDQCIR